jgi:UDP-glucose 4-epimerase
VLYIKGDIRDKSITEIFKEHQVDTVVHLASIVTPGKKSNREFEYSVDVLGTENVLNACVENKVKKIIVTSSGASYGYYADNPEWLDEYDKIRGNEEFAYSHHKRLVEEMLTKYREEHPELKQLILRPGTILGENVKNQITNLFEKKFVLGIKGSGSPFVFIWDQDVVNIIIEGIHHDKNGIFNLAGDGTLTLKQIAEILHKPYIEISATVLGVALSFLKMLGLTQYGPEQVNFLRYRPVLANRRLKEEFGYIPKYTTREVFDFYLKSKK